MLKDLIRFDKMNKRSVFVQNRLKRITNLGNVFPVKFGFCVGKENPADCITRPLSYKQLIGSNYLTKHQSLFLVTVFLYGLLIFISKPLTP